MNKPRIRIRPDINTVTLINPSDRWGFQVLHNNEIKRCENLIELIMLQSNKFNSWGLNGDKWLKLVRLG